MALRGIPGNRLLTGLVGDFQRVVLNDRIGKEFAAKRVQRLFIGICREFDFDAFSDTHPACASQAMVIHGLGDSGPLRVKNGEFGHNMDDGLHRLILSMRVLASGFKLSIVGR